MAALQTIIAASAGITGGAFEALTGQGGDTLGIASAGTGPINLVDVWGADDTSAFEFDIRSSLLHDNVRGIRMAGKPPAPGAVTAHGPALLPPLGLKQPL